MRNGHAFINETIFCSPFLTGLSEEVFSFVFGAWRTLIDFSDVETPGGYQRLDLFIEVLRVWCTNLTDASIMPDPESKENTKEKNETAFFFHILYVLLLYTVFSLKDRGRTNVF